MHYLDTNTRRQLMQEHRERLAEEMRRARGPMPSERGETSWSSRLAKVLPTSQRMRAEDSRTPAYHS
jgi:hypothetical protein